MFTKVVETVEELLALPSVDFRFVVACDVKDRLISQTKKFLRSPEVNTRWNAELRLLWVETLKERDTSRDSVHRHAVLQFQNYIRIRRAEASALCQEYEQLRQAKKLPPVLTPPQKGSNRSLRRKSLARAMTALCEKYWDELTALYLEDVLVTWPEGGTTPQCLPAKCLREMGIHSPLMVQDQWEDEGLSPKE